MWEALALHTAAAVPWRKAVAVALAVPVLLGLSVGAALMSSTLEEEATDVRGQCAVTVNPAGLSVAGLDQQQMQHAATIVEVGRQKGVPEQGIRVALAVAAQESKFRNYANDGTGQLRPDQRDVSRSLTYPHDAVGRDHGSVNVFQQQYPWWGTLDELMDPRYAAGKFFDTLIEVPGWQQMPLTIAAQKVQRSAFPNAYARWEPLAGELLAALGASTVPARQPPNNASIPVQPGVGQTVTTAGDPCATRAIPADFAALPGADAGQVAVNAAASWIGTPYSWGGGTIAGPSEGFAQGAGIVGFDCSGLILHAWYQAAGIRLPHSSVAIEAMGTPVAASQAQAGDVVSFATAGGTRVSHDGLFDGRGGMVHAPRTGKTVEYVPDVLNHPYWSTVLVSITRPPLPDTGQAASMWSVSVGPRNVEP